MFESAFKEKDSSELTLPDKEYSSFVEFLQCIYPGYNNPVTEERVCYVIPLAHEYQIPDLLERCEVVLKDSIGPSSATSDIYMNLRLAHLYSLEELQERCIELASERALSDMMENKETYAIPCEVHEKVLVHRVRRQELDITEYKAMIDYSKRRLANFSEDIISYLIQTTMKRLPKAAHRLFELRVFEKINGEDPLELKTMIIQKYAGLNENVELFEYLPASLKEKILRIKSGLSD